MKKQKGSKDAAQNKKRKGHKGVTKNSSGSESNVEKSFIDDLW